MGKYAVANDGREAWTNPALGKTIDDQGRLCNPLGEPYPEAVQAVYAVMLPTADASAALLLREAITQVLHQERTRPPVYVCTHCRDGKDLPKGYECKRCGEANPTY